MKTPIATLCGVPRHCVEIVDKEEGIIYDDYRDVTTLSRPLQVIVGTDERRVPFYLLTTDADMIDQDPDDEEPRLKMSCGHAISQCSCIWLLVITTMQSAHQLHYIGCLKIAITRVYEQTIEPQVPDNPYIQSARWYPTKVRKLSLNTIIYTMLSMLNHIFLSFSKRV